MPRQVIAAPGHVLAKVTLVSPLRIVTLRGRFLVLVFFFRLPSRGRFLVFFFFFSARLV